MPRTVRTLIRPAYAAALLLGAALAVSLAFALAFATPAGAAHRARGATHPRHLLQVVWMDSYAAPGTPVYYDQVGVLKIGSPKARNVLVFEPGTSAGSAYIVPLAQWLVNKMPNWQVWSVERRQNLLEDQSVLTLAKEGKATPKQVFDYYLGWLVNPKIKHHVAIPSGPDRAHFFAKGWGLNVAMQDLHVVIQAARRLGGKVVLSGHSLGGALVTAYATWDFHGRPGADDLSGLVFDDGASFGSAVSAAKARSDLAALMAPDASPWGGVSGGQFPAPLLGLFSSAGALAAVMEPNSPSLGTAVLPPSLTPPVPLSNLALWAWNTNVSTSKLGVSDFAILAHEGKGISSRIVNGVHLWNAAGALTPPSRYARMVAGPDVKGADGFEWYFPYRLTLDIADGLGNGVNSPAERVLGLHATMGDRLPHSLLMYAFGAFGGTAILDATKALAKQSHIPMRNLTLINRHGAYAHNDPAGAYPNNAFFTWLMRFLRKVDRLG